LKKSGEKGEVMIIAYFPKCNSFPPNVKTKAEKTAYLSTGRVTVGRYATLTNHDIVDFYLPRIKGFSFRFKNKKSGGAKTPEEAYKYGLYLKRKFMQEVRRERG
jgi:hypothetical protein